MDHSRWKPARERTIPTLPLLAKLAKGRDASLNIAIEAEDAHLSLTAHDAA
jgi:hypothetical protein